MKTFNLLVSDHADSGSESLSGSESNAAKALDSNVAPKVLKIQKHSLLRTKLYGVFSPYLFLDQTFTHLRGKISGEVGVLNVWFYGSMMLFEMTLCLLRKL